MQENETVKEDKELTEGEKLMHINGKDTEKAMELKQGNKTRGVYGARPILVSEQQFLTVKEETLTSLNLLNLSANVLLGAMNKMIPPEDSPRALGEYSAHGIRQLAKSICDVIQTKNSVIRQIHSIARDEF